MIHLDEEWSTYKKLLFLQAMGGGGGANEYEITGNPVSFQTNLARPLSSFTIPFLPVQSGTGDPSPENIRPISGWTGITANRAGKNLVNIAPVKVTSQTVIGGYFALKAGTYSFSVTVKNNSSIHGAMKITVNRTQVGSAVAIIANTTSRLKIQNITIDKDSNMVGIVINGASAGYDFDISDVMVELGSTASPYAEYTGESYPVVFPDGQTVYGGTLDAVNGVLTVDKAQFAFKDLVSLNGASPNWAYNSTYNLFETRNAIIPTGTANTETGIVCSCYQSRPYGYNSSHSSENSIVWAHTSGTLRIKDNRYTDVDVWKTAIADEQIVIPLAEPIEIQLDPLSVQTLIGDNTIWTDTNGENTIRYKKKG